MYIKRLVEQVQQKLQNVDGVSIAPIREDAPATINELRQLEEELGIELPDVLRELYLHDSDGISLSWFAEDHVFGKECNSGELNILSTDQLRMIYADMKAIVEDARNGEYGDVDTEGVRLLINDWGYWIPVTQFSNGDAFCIETRDASHPIVFMQHDVMDGGPDIHGLRIAPNMETLMSNWAEVCFVDIYDWTPGVDADGIDPSKELFSLLR